MGSPRHFSSWHRTYSRVLATERPDPVPAGASADQVRAWQRRARGRLNRLIGRLPDRVPLDFEVVESVDCGSYRRDKVVYDVEEHLSAPAYLLVPHARTRPGPAVLAQHGHGAGKDEVVGLADSENPNSDYAHQLAERGYVVLAPDLRTFGERRDWNPENIYGCDHSHLHATQFGENLLGLHLWDSARALDVLAAQPEVNARRLGVVGLSQGGTIALFLAAWDRRVRAAVVSGYFSSWRAAAAIPWNMCGSQVLFGMLGELEHVDLAALVAPRALLVETGTDDPIFPTAVAQSEHAALAKVYAELGAADATAIDVFAGGHQWHGVAAYDFLAAHL
jgi:dienelactone hydrolase